MITVWNVLLALFIFTTWAFFIVIWVIKMEKRRLEIADEDAAAEDWSRSDEFIEDFRPGLSKSLPWNMWKTWKKWRKR